MTNTFTKIAGIGAMIAAFAASPVMAQDMMSDWDGDGDGIVSQEEFGTGWADNNAYSTWDSDGDGALTEDEFNTGVFGSYDADDSGAIEEPEFGDVGDDIGDGGFWDV